MLLYVAVDFSLSIWGFIPPISSPGFSFPHPLPSSSDSFPESHQDVIIMRVKNRMHPPDGSAATASGGGSNGALEANTTGYRDVAINLRVCSSRTLLLSLHWHAGTARGDSFYCCW